MTRRTSTPDTPTAIVNATSPVAIGVGLVMIYEYRLRESSDVAAFLTACEVLARSVGAKGDHLEICWLYGKDPNRPLTIRCLIGFWSLSAQIEFNKSKRWKQFVKTTQALPHETSVQLIEELRGGVLFHRQLLRPAA